MHLSFPLINKTSHNYYTNTIRLYHVEKNKTLTKLGKRKNHLCYLQKIHLTRLYYWKAGKQHKDEAKTVNMVDRKTSIRNNTAAVWLWLSYWLQGKCHHVIWPLSLSMHLFKWLVNYLVHICMSNPRRNLLQSKTMSCDKNIKISTLFLPALSKKKPIYKPIA